MKQRELRNPRSYPHPYCDYVWNIEDVEQCLFLAAQTLVRLPTSVIVKEPKDSASWWPEYKLDKIEINIYTYQLLPGQITMMDIVLCEWIPYLELELREIVWLRTRRGIPTAWRRIATRKRKSHEYCRLKFLLSCQIIANRLNMLG